jgi:hypothetical protein
MPGFELLGSITGSRSLGQDGDNENSNDKSKGFHLRKKDTEREEKRKQ